MARRAIKVNLRPPSESVVPSAAEIFSLRWARLHTFLNRVYSLHSGSASAVEAAAAAAAAASCPTYEELYGDVVDICSQRQSQELYSRLCQCTSGRAAALLDGIPLQGTDAAAFLAHLRQAWGLYCSELSLQYKLSATVGSKTR